MKLSDLLAKLKDVKDIEIEERKQQDGTTVFVFSSTLPFPKFEPAWYPIVIRPGQTEVDNREIEAMLRHLWQFQLDILPEEGSE